MKRIFYYFVALLCLFLLICGLFIAYAFISVPDVSVLVNKNPETTSFIEHYKNQSTSCGDSLKVFHEWTSLDEIPQTIWDAIVLAEDAEFWNHNGIDWHALKKAFSRTWNEGLQLQGASTITQQLAKNLYLYSDRSVFRKLREYFIARELEKKLGKRRILELYLGCIEFGQGIYGIKSAAEQFFNKPLSELEISEIVRLSAVIPSPHKLHPNEPTRLLRWRSLIILDRLYKNESISESKYRQAEKELSTYFEGK